MKTRFALVVAVIVWWCPVTGCTQNHTDDAGRADTQTSTSQDGKRQTGLIEESPETPPPKVTFDEYTFEKCAATDPHPEDYFFTRGGKRIFTLDVAPNETVTLIRPKNIDDYEDPRLDVFGDDSDTVLVERHLPEDENNCTYSVYSLSPTVKVLGTQRTHQQIRLENEGDGIWQFKTIAWNTAWGARPAAPELILKWSTHKKRFLPDRDAMRKRISTWNLRELKRVNRQQFKSLPKNPELVINNAPPELAEQVFEMCYSGRADLARKFYNDCWPGGRPGKKTYWRFLINEASKGDYWSNVSAMSATKRSPS